MKAAIDREVIDEKGTTLNDHLHVDVPKGAMVCRDGFVRMIDKKNVSVPAYLCLSCGTEYGELTFTRKQKEHYEKQDQKD